MNTYLAKRQAPAADLSAAVLHLVEYAPSSKVVYVKSNMRNKHNIIIKKKSTIITKSLINTKYLVTLLQKQITVYSKP